MKCPALLMPTKMINIQSRVPAAGTPLFRLMHKKRKEKLLMKKCKEVMTVQKKVKIKNLRLIALPLTKKEWMWILRSLQSLKMM